MSQENVEVVRAHWEAREHGWLDARIQFWHRDIEWTTMEGAPDDIGVMRGHEACRAYVQDWLDLFEHFTNVPVEIIDAGGDHVVSVQRMAGRARLSGAATSLYYAILYTMDNGLIRSIREYATRAEALEAAGLSE
jgi:ketosteroid isomerase-like protein